MTEEKPEMSGDEPIAKDGIEFELETSEPWKKVAKVQVSLAHMDGIRAVVVEDLRKKAKIPGFRKGKVPASIITSQFGGQVEQEALERVIPEVYREVLNSHEDIEPVAEPRVSNLEMDEGQPLGFDLEIEVRPPVALEGLGNLNVERTQTEITDDRVDQAMDELAERNAKWAPVQRGARPGDALEIDYIPLNDAGEPDEKEGKQDYHMELGAEGVLPEFNAALEGLEPGEDTTVAVEYPEDYPREDLAGQQRSFQVTLKEVKEKQLPELNDDLAQSISPHQTLAALRDSVRDELVGSAQREGDRGFREALIDAILETNDVSVPPSLEARYLQAILSDLEKGSGQSLDDETRQQLAERYRPAARRAVQRILLVDHVRKIHDLEVTDDELNGKIEELAEKQGVSPQEFRHAVESSNNMGRLQNDLEEDKVFDHLAGQVQVTVIDKKADDADSPAAAPSSETDQAVE